MLYIILGSISFLLFLAFDYCSFYEKNILKYMCGILGLILLLNSTILILSNDGSLNLNSMFQLTTYILSLIFFALLVYSVFIEIGKNNYEMEAKPQLVVDGTYSLVRHPGVLWFLFTYVFLSLAFHSRFLLAAAIVWSIINVIYTYIQEKRLLYRVFNNYDSYKKTTPMFVPNITSMKRFITLNNWRKK